MPEDGDGNDMKIAVLPTAIFDIDEESKIMSINFDKLVDFFRSNKMGPHLVMKYGLQSERTGACLTITYRGYKNSMTQSHWVYGWDVPQMKDWKLIVFDTSKKVM